ASPHGTVEKPSPVGGEVVGEVAHPVVVGAAEERLKLVASHGRPQALGGEHTNAFLFQKKLARCLHVQAPLPTRSRSRARGSRWDCFRTATLSLVRAPRIARWIDWPLGYLGRALSTSSRGGDKSAPEAGANWRGRGCSSLSAKATAGSGGGRGRGTASAYPFR